MSITEGGASGKLVAVLKKVSFSYGEHLVIRELSSTVMRGDRIGVIGPNGAGKTTLLKLMLGKLAPSAGEVKLGTNLQPVYFDQQRAQLDPARSVAENIGEGGDFIEINGRRRHVIGYLGDFLFTPDRARSPVGILSGGERNRLLLARIFAKPSNILVLDEPTNDLDMETLELLEELLLEYKGTVLLVSHDRAFINNVVTSTLVFEAGGIVQEYAGGYDDWLKQRPLATRGKQENLKEAAETVRQKPAGPRKLTFKEVKELEGMEKGIEILEQEQQELYDKMADPSFYQGEGALVAATGARLTELEELLASSYQRWEELEAVNEEYLAWKKG